MHAESLFVGGGACMGRSSIVGEGFPVLALAARDKAEASVVAIADQLVDQGARVFAHLKRVEQGDDPAFCRDRAIR